MSFNEKLSYTEHSVVSPTSDFTIGFEDYALTTKDRINVTVDDIDAKDAGYTVTRKNNLVVTLTPPVPSGVVRLQRETNIDTPFHRFTAGAKFVAANVDQNFTQILHSQQEVRNLFGFTQEYIQRTLDNFDLRIQGAEDIVLDLRQDYNNLDKRITKEVGDRKQGDQELKDYIDSTVNGITGENFLPIHDNFVSTEDGRTQRELNNTFKDNLNTVTSIEEALSLLNAVVASNKYVSVKHYRKDGFIYDVITGIQPHQLEIKSNQISSDSPTMLRLTAKQASEKFNRPIVVNASAFKNADGTTGWNNDLLVPNGIHIQDGRVVTGWEYANAPTRNQAVCLMNTGELKRFYREETTVQDMVDQGAILGQSWGGWLVYDSVVPSDFATAVINDSGKSAKTVIFQMPDNSIGFLLIEGVSGSYGATSAEAGQICLELGVKCAYNLDGGGSTQCYWGNAYAVPSSDTTTRTLASYFTVNTESVLPYDSGIVQVAHNSAVFGDAVSDNSKPPLFLRQKSDEVTLYLNINSNALPPSATTAVTDGTAVPARYRSNTPIYSRALLLGGGGRMFRCYQGGGSYLGLFNVEPVDSALIPTALVGKVDWTQKHI